MGGLVPGGTHVIWIISDRNRNRGMSQPMDPISGANTKGQLISKCPFGVIGWTKIPTKKFDNFCPGGQIKKIKALSYINYRLFNVIKCL